MGGLEVVWAPLMVGFGVLLGTAWQVLAFNPFLREVLFKDHTEFTEFVEHCEQNLRPCLLRWDGDSCE